MKICVSSELDSIKQELEHRGYNVVTNSSSEPCDAIICDLKNGGLSGLNNQSYIRREGTLIIDSGGKTIEEIEYILNNRVYSSLI